MNKSNMLVNVSFLAGTSIEDACTEAKGYALKNNLAYVKFDFNGISCSISQRADISKAREKFDKVMRWEAEYKFFIE